MSNKGTRIDLDDLTEEYDEEKLKSYTSGGTIGVEELAEALEDEDMRTRREATRVFNEIASSFPSVITKNDAVPQLVEQLGSQEGERLELLSETIKSICDTEPKSFADTKTVELLLDLLGDSPEEAQEGLKFGLAGAIIGNSQKALDGLVDGVESSEKEVRSVAMATLSLLARNRSEGIAEVRIETLVEALSDDSEEVRRSAAEVLGSMADDHPREVMEADAGELIPLVVKALDGEEFKVRAAAVTTLAALGFGSPEEMDIDRRTELLVGALDDEKPEVRYVAVESIGRILVGQGDDRPTIINEDESLSALVDALNDDSPDVRREAVSGLGDIGEEKPELVSTNPEVVDELIDRLHDDDEFTRQSALRAVEDIAATKPEVFDDIDIVAHGVELLGGDNTSSVLESFVRITDNSPEMLEESEAKSEMVSELVGLVNSEDVEVPNQIQSSMILKNIASHNEELLREVGAVEQLREAREDGTEEVQRAADITLDMFEDDST